MKKLIDSKKITRKQLIQKLMSVTDREEANEADVEVSKHNAIHFDQDLT